MVAGGAMDEEWATETIVRISKVTMPDIGTIEESWSFTIPTVVTIRDVKSLYIAPDAEFEPVYTLDKHYKLTEWGASGATAEYIVQLAQDVSSELLLASLALVVKKVKDRIGIFQSDDAQFGP
jgi:hypothetical protein